MTAQNNRSPVLCDLLLFIEIGGRGLQGMSGFHFRGGGVNRAPQNWGGGGSGKGLN